MRGLAQAYWQFTKPKIKPLERLSRLISKISPLSLLRILTIFLMRFRLRGSVEVIKLNSMSQYLIHSFIYFIHSLLSQSFVMFLSQSFICIFLCIHYLILILHNTFVYVRFYIASSLNFYNKLRRKHLNYFLIYIITNS